MQMSVIEWLLDSDPSIRWQVMRDLIAESDATVARERSRVAAEGDESNPEAIWTYCGYAAAAAGPLPIAACGSRLDRGSAFRIRCYLCCPRRLDDLPLRADHGRPLFRR